MIYNWGSKYVFVKSMREMARMKQIKNSKVILFILCYFLKKYLYIDKN